MIGVDSKTGKHLSGNAHLRQSIIDILTTPIGSRVLRRDYGSSLYDLIDNPQDISTKLKIISATAGALSKWEPRIIIKKVSVTFVEMGAFELSIMAQNKEFQTIINIDGVKINGN